MKLIDKLRQIEKQLSEEQGSFYLFGLFQREEAADKWDLLVSAAWIQKDKYAGLQLIAKRIQDKLSKDEVIQLSRIVLIDDDNPALESLNRSIQIEHGITEIRNSNFFDLDIKRAIIITSQNNLAVAK